MSLLKLIPLGSSPIVISVTFVVEVVVVPELEPVLPAEEAGSIGIQA